MTSGRKAVDQIRGVVFLRFLRGQGQTADRVLIHVDTELGAKDLINSRMAYVSVSRGRYDAQIYTDNASALGQELSRDVSHAPAIQWRKR